MLLQRGENFLAPQHHRQIFRVANHRHARPTRLDRLHRGLDLHRHFHQPLINRQAFCGTLFQPIQARAQRMAVARQAVIELIYKCGKFGNGHELRLVLPPLP